MSSLLTSLQLIMHNNAQLGQRNKKGALNILFGMIITHVIVAPIKLPHWQMLPIIFIILYIQQKDRLSPPPMKKKQLTLLRMHLRLKKIPMPLLCLNSQLMLMLIHKLLPMKKTLLVLNLSMLSMKPLIYLVTPSQLLRILLQKPSQQLLKLFTSTPMVFGKIPSLPLTTKIWQKNKKSYLIKNMNYKKLKQMHSTIMIERLLVIMKWTIQER